MSNDKSKGAKLYDLLMDHFITLLENGEASTKDCEAIIRFLNNSGVDSATQLTPEEVPDFLKSLPFDIGDAA